MDKKHFQNILSPDGLKPSTLKDFFLKSDRRLSIPDYQRPYSWEKSHLEDLLTDINKCVEEKSGWFLGTIFSTLNSQKDNPHFLLDGQQRLTSFQLLFWNLRRVGYEISEKIDWDNIINENPEKDKSFSDFNDKYGVLKSILFDSDNKKRFSVQLELDEEWTSFLDKIRNPRNSESITSYLSQEFKQSLIFKSQQGYPSAERILNNNTFIYESLVNDVFNKKSLIEKAEIFSNYCDVIFNKFWCIEIELESDKESLKIFEALNNRGKSLTLTDKLRFKCLIHYSGNIEKIRELWKDIFISIDTLTLKGYINNEDVFFKYFLNITNPKDLTKERDLITHFENEYLNSDSEIEQFCQDALKVLRHNITLDKFNNDDFEIPGLDGRDQEKASAIYSTFRKLLFASDNARFLYYRHILDCDENTGYDILQGLVAIIRMVINTEVLRPMQSNKIRNKYLGIIKSTIDYKSKESKREDSKSPPPEIRHCFFNHLNIEYTPAEIIDNIIIQNDNSMTIFLIYYISLIKNHSSIINQVQKIDNSKTHLEHMFPNSWRENWKPKGQIHIEAIKKIYKDTFPSNTYENHLNDVIKDEVLFSEMDKTHPDKCFGQWIGNKWVLHQKLNQKISNKSYSEKVKEIKKSEYLCLPSAEVDRIGTDNFEEFDVESIVKRSYSMSTIICQSLRKNIQWDLTD